MSEFQPIGSFSKVRRGASPRPINNPDFFGGDVGWVRISDVTQRNKKYLRQTQQYLSPLGQSRSLRVDAGDLIMSICATVGKPMIVDMPACIHDGFVQIYDIQNADTEYLYYLLQFHEKDFEKRGQPGTQVNLNTTIVENEVVFIPSLMQQQKIAKILSTIDNLIEKTQTLIDKYTAIKQGMMADLFTRGIDMTTGDNPSSKGGKLRPSVEAAPELYKQTELGWVPKEWEVTTLENEHQIHSGSTPSRQEVERYFKNGNIQWIKTLDLNEAEIRTTEEQITKLALKESSCRLLPVNTVLIAMYGGWIQIGRTAILKAECATNQAICALIPSPEKLIPEFSVYYLQHFKEVWKKVAISTRKDPNITKSDVNRFPYLIPSLSEQHEIVLKINSINDVLKNQVSSREKFKKQKKGLMQDLLTGKVRVD